MNILEELWYGNIYPNEQSMRILFAAPAVRVTAGPRTRKSFRTPASRKVRSRKPSRF